MPLHPVDRAARYTSAVLDGRVPACAKLTQAVLRSVAGVEGTLIDEVEVARTVAFIECLPHVKGRLARSRLALEDWQCWLIAELDGRRRVEDGLRHYREAYVQLPRKNAKTTLGIALGLKFFAFDGEAGAECFTAASGQDQASIAYKIGRQMVLGTPALASARRITVTGGATYAGSMALPDGSFFRPLPRDRAGSLDGYSPHFALMDEIHAYPDSATYDALQQGMGARDQPMLLGITTAGYGLHGFGHGQYERASRLLDGSLDLPTVFALVYEAEPADDPYSEATLRKANPGYGTIVRTGYLRDQAARAKASSAAERAYQTKHLNMWVGADSSWLTARQCLEARHTYSWDDMAGADCWIAVDMAEVKDLFAAAYWFWRPDLGRLVCKIRAWTCSAAVSESPRLAAMASQGAVEIADAVGGGRIDDDAAFRVIASDTRRYNVRRVVYDPWHMDAFAARLWRETGVERAQALQGYRAYTRPMKQLEAAVAAREVLVDDHPALLAAVDATIAQANPLGEIKPAKRSRGDLIDPAVAMVMGYAPASVEAGDERPAGAVQL